jgi:hypothetical protein
MRQELRRGGSAATVTIALVALCGSVARADEEPKVWQQLFFPFPIVGAPPQLEQQVQVFNSYFRGSAGSGDVISAELAYILSPQLGVVLNVPFQVGFEGQTTGFQDTQILLQGLAAGSLEHDCMLSVGLEGTLPTGRADLSAGSAYVGLFAYGAKRFFHHLIFEADVTALFPITNADSARQLIGAGLVSVLLTPRRFDFPIYAQFEVDSTFYYVGTVGLPGDATSAPAGTVFVAPEIFLGPFKTPISSGTRVAAGVSFDVAGDPIHARTYTVTVAFDIANKYGY